MRRLLPVLVLIVGTLCMFSSVAGAQPAAGDKEIALGGQLFTNINPDSKLTFGQVFFGVGFFLTDRFEWSIRPTINVTSFHNPGQPAIPEIRIGNILLQAAQPAIPGGTDVDFDGGLGTGVRYLFGRQSSKVKPFVGGGVEIQRFKTNGGSFKDNMYAGGQVGLKNYLSEKTSVDFEFADTFGFSAPGDSQLLTFKVQLSYLF
jgi:hypothetical protein